MSDTYNGWSNYETWNVALWMSNDSSSYEYFNELAQECYDRADGDTHQEKIDDAASDLASAIESYHDDQMPEVSGCFADILGAAMQAVDWREIAEHLLSDIEAPETEETEETEEEKVQS